MGPYIIGAECRPIQSIARTYPAVLEVSARAWVFGNQTMFSFWQRVSVMQELQRQVRVARRRMALQSFLSMLPWTLTGFLLIAAVGVAVPKRYPLPVDTTVWNVAWIGGALAAGVILAAILAFCRRHDRLDRGAHGDAPRRRPARQEALRVDRPRDRS